MQWFKENPNKLTELKNDLFREFPSLQVIEHDGKIIVRGGFPVVQDGVELNRYSVEIIFPDNYPLHPPEIREIGGKIERNEDRHTEKDGKACLMAREQYWLEDYPNRPILDFFNVPVRNYFLFQVAKDGNIAWSHGELDHGYKGIVEFYSEMLGIDDIDTILRCLFILVKFSPQSQWKCPCGSGTKMRNCHRILLKLQREVPKDILNLSVTSLMEQLDKEGRLKKYLKKLAIENI